MLIYDNYHPEFENEKFTKENIFKSLFPGKGYNDEVFRNLNSDLLKLSLEFIAIQNFLNEPVNLKKHLLSELNERKIFSLFEKVFEVSIKNLDESGNRDINYFLNSYYIYSENELYHALRKNFASEDISIIEKIITKFYILKMMELHNYSLHQSRILKFRNNFFVESRLFENFFKKLPEEINNLPQIQIYYNALKLEETNDMKYYFSLKEYINESGHLIEKNNLYNKFIEMIEFIKRNKSIKNDITISELFAIRNNMD